MPRLYAAEPLEQRLLLAVLYVDLNAPGPLHDGLSWDSAYADLQPALINARAGDQIRIAAGTYRPTTDTDRTKSFQLRSGVALCGGYGGNNAADPDVRDFQLFPTILSGEIGDPNATSDNSYHVLYAEEVNATAILDGLTITAGNANGNGGTPYYSGGGMYSTRSFPTVTNCNFQGNSGGSGGGMFNNSSSPTLANCSFSGNSASGNGGGTYNFQSSPSLTNCIFSGNSAGNYGGGTYDEALSPALAFTSCTFIGNSAKCGGGICQDSSSVTLTDCEFSGNLAEYSGGGVEVRDSFAATLTLTNCSFTRNSAGSYGGGLETTSSFPTLINCSFSGNSAGRYGGGMYSGGGSIGGPYKDSLPKLANCSFSGNSAKYGGGMYNTGSLSLTNCSLGGNLAYVAGGGLYTIMSSPSLVNCILWENTGQQIVGSAKVTYSLVQGGLIETGTGNLDADPQFVRDPNPGHDGVWATADDDYGDLRLRSTSPALNAGNSLALPPGLTTDLSGGPRMVGDRVDLGAYETPGQPVNVTFATSIQQLPENIGIVTVTLNLSQPMDTPVFVPLLLGGTATLDSDYRLLSPSSLVFEPGSTSVSFDIEVLDDRSCDPGETVMVHLGKLTNVWYGAIATYTIAIANDDEPPVLYVDDTATGANNGSSWADAYTSLQAALQSLEAGAAIWVAAGTYKPGVLRTDSFQLRNHVVIYGGFPNGGGTWQQRNLSANPAILSGEIGDPSTTSDNSYHVVSARGVGATAILDGVTITGGNANADRESPDGCGGGMANSYASPTITNCIFRGNSADLNGGGLYNDSACPVLINCSFSGNSAEHGGGMYNDGSASILTNCTFSGNSASMDGGGVYNSGCFPTLTNCILWGNPGQQIATVNNGEAIVSYSLVQGGISGTGNLNVDPQFVRNPSPGLDSKWATADDDYGDLRLRSTSPALNVGSNAAVPAGITTDLGGNPRIVAGRVDLGAYEAGIPNHPPVASGFSISTNEDTSASLQLSASDADGNGLTYKVRSGPAHGKLTGTVPNLVYTPDANYNGSDTFTYLANDGTADSPPAAVSITVKAVNDAPGFTKGADLIAQAGAGTQTVVGWAANRSVGPANESGQTFTFLVGTDNDGLFAVKPAISPSGTLTYTPAANVSGTATVTVRLKDSGGTANGGQDTSAAQTFSITITPGNTPPVLAAIPDQSINEGILLSFRAVATDSDLPAQTLSFSLDSGAPAGASIDPVTGVFTWTPAFAQAGQYTFRVCVSDNGSPSLSATQLVTISVKDAIVPQLQVTNVTAIPSGFDIQFNQPIDLSKLNLYDGMQNKGRVADMTVVGAKSGAISGTAIWEVATNTLHFVKTGGLLAADDYILTLFSRADGFVGLDGDQDGSTGGDFVQSVKVSAGAGPTLSLPDIARGPNQSFSLPVKLDTTAGVLSVHAELVFDSMLLSISDITLASGLPADWTAVANLKAPGRMVVTAYGTTALGAGAKDLLLVKASVPATALYGAAGILKLEAVKVNGGVAQGDAAVQVVAYLGDASSNRSYSGMDAAYIANVAIGAVTGFDAFPMVDPVIVGDVNGNGSLGGLDASFVAQKSVGMIVNQIPDLPAAAPAAPLAEKMASTNPPFATQPLCLTEVPAVQVVMRPTIVAQPARKSLDDVFGQQPIMPEILS